MAAALARVPQGQGPLAMRAGTAQLQLPHNARAFDALAANPFASIRALALGVGRHCDADATAQVTNMIEFWGMPENVKTGYSVDGKGLGGTDTGCAALLMAVSRSNPWHDPLPTPTPHHTTPRLLPTTFSDWNPEPALLPSSTGPAPPSARPPRQLLPVDGEYAARTFEG